MRGGGERARERARAREAGGLAPWHRYTFSLAPVSVACGRRERLCVSPRAVSQCVLVSQVALVPVGSPCAAAAAAAVAFEGPLRRASLGLRAASHGAVCVLRGGLWSVGGQSQVVVLVVVGGHSDLAKGVAASPPPPATPSGRQRPVLRQAWQITEC